MNTWASEYRSERAFWVGLRTRATRHAPSTGTSSQELIRRFIIERFTARMFAHDDAPWVIAGGTGMLIRAPGIRATRDLDLTTLAPAAGEPDAVQDTLTRYTGASTLDPFIFTISDAKPFTGAIRGTKLRINATISTERATTFGLDVAADTIAISDIEYQPMQPAIPDVRGLAPLPAVPLFPLASQIADKIVGVMFRDDQDRSANRYRDLVDLVLYADAVDVDAAQLTAALTARAATRNQPTPQAITIPDGWAQGYASTADRTTLPTALRDVETAGEVVNAWLAPVLSGTISTGHIWDHHAAAWRPPEQAPQIPGQVWVRAHTRNGTPIGDYYRRTPGRR